MLFEKDEPEESSLTIEETGGFEQIEENSSASDHGWKDELNLAEFPIAALESLICCVFVLTYSDKTLRQPNKTYSAPVAGSQSCSQQC